jgi:hypothetical protein
LESHYHFALDAGVRHPGVWIDRVDRVYRFDWIDWVHWIDGIDGVDGVYWIDRFERRYLCRGVGCCHGIYRWYDGQREQHQLSRELVDAG